MHRWTAAGLGLVVASQLTTSEATPKSRTRVVFDMKSGTGQLRYEIRDQATGKRIPGKLTVIGVKGTRDPRFSKGDIGRQESDASGTAAFNRVFSADGSGDIPLPFGTYDITASRGLEWTISTQRIEITTAGASLDAKLAHVIDTPKWASADFHVHAEPSPDSNVPMSDRVYEFVAEGVDMIVSSDHNTVATYRPEIDRLELGKKLAAAAGDEISSGWGHFGAFPLPADKPAPDIKRKTPQQIFDAFRAAAPDAVINVHHPRLEKETGYFWIGKYDPKTGKAKRKDFSFGFDAIELLNGYEDTRRTLLDRNMTDWFALLDHGHLVTATGNSDTHHLTYNLGGYPRNYVMVDNDDPGVVTGADMAKGIKARRAFLTTGPFIGVTSGTANIGDLAPAPGGKATLDIVVRAAPWVSVSRVKLYVGGKLVKTYDVPATEQVERLKTSYELSLDKDSYAVVRVEGDKPLTPVIGGVGGGTPIYPLAVANPILFDVDGNKQFDAPK